MTTHGDKDSQQDFVLVVFVFRMTPTVLTEEFAIFDVEHKFPKGSVIVFPATKQIGFSELQQEIVEPAWQFHRLMQQAGTRPTQSHPGVL